MSESVPDTSSASGASSDELYAVFRSRRGRAVPMTMAALALLLFTGFAALVPGRGDGGSFGTGDRLMMFFLGLTIALFLWRYVGIKAVPDQRGIVVRNLILSRRVEWPEVEAVRFHGGAAWPVLTLHDGEEVAVMAVQKADGGRASTEATRLATLVQRGGGGQASPS